MQRKQRGQKIGLFVKSLSSCATMVEPFQRFLSNILLLNVEENIETVQRDLREVHEMVNSSMGATN